MLSEQEIRIKIYEQFPVSDREPHCRSERETMNLLRESYGKKLRGEALDPDRWEKLKIKLDDQTAAS